MDNNQNKYPIVKVITTFAQQTPETVDTGKRKLEHLVVRAVGQEALHKFGTGEQGEAAAHLTLHLSRKAVKYGGKAFYLVQPTLGYVGRKVQDHLDDFFRKETTK